MKNMYHIQEIRLLPMDKEEEFKTEADVRKFLAADLIQRDGKYYYRERGIIVENGYALILFQYDGAVIGYGVLKDVVKDECTDVIDGKTIEYKGYLQFFTISVHNVEKITLAEITKISNNIKKFSQSKQFIEMERFDQVYSLLRKKQIEYSGY